MLESCLSVMRQDIAPTPSFLHTTRAACGGRHSLQPKKEGNLAAQLRNFYRRIVSVPLSTRGTNF